MNKKLIIKIAIGVATLAGAGYGIHKLYQKKHEPKEVIDISDKTKEEKPEESKPEEKSEEPEEVIEAEVEEEPESDEDDEEEDDEDYDDTDEYDTYYNRWK